MHRAQQARDHRPGRRLGTTGLVGAGLAAPALSYAADDGAALSDRVVSLRQALEGLVSDGTLTQPQADEVAATLAEQGPLDRGRHSSGLSGGREVVAAAAAALGLTQEDLRTAASEGTTRAELADREGVATSAVVDAMVGAVEDHPAEDDGA